jgi:GntR family transcriptional regulator/MocR family aminotransferase
MGGQNALWLAAQVLLNQRRTAVMENPGYPGLRVALNLARCNVVNVPVDHAGMRLDSLPTRPTWCSPRRAIIVRPA